MNVTMLEQIGFHLHSVVQGKEILYQMTHMQGLYRSTYIKGCVPKTADTLINT